MNRLSGTTVPYGSMHRYFLRTISSLGVLSTQEMQEILKKKFGNDEKNIQDIVKLVNEKIRPYQQEIRITNDEMTDEEVVVFMSLGYDDATKSHNAFSPNELEFFRTLLEQVMTTESRQVTGINAMNLVSRMKTSLNKVDTQRLLNIWCKMRYLEKEENNYALGVRTIHEFEGYFRQNMPDTIAECCLCKKIVYRGYNCPGCALAVHTRCLKRYIEKVEKWPCCKINFNKNQLDQLNNESSRLSQTQQLQTTQQSVAYNTIAEATLNHDSIDDIDLSQATVSEQPQSGSRKRKR